MHYKEVITEKKTEAVKCNYTNKPDCPLSNQCQIMNKICKAKFNQIFTINMKKYTTKSTKVYLNSVMETINHSITKNIGQILSFQRNTGELTKQNLKYNFTF